MPDFAHTPRLFRDTAAAAGATHAARNAVDDFFHGVSVDTVDWTPDGGAHVVHDDGTTTTVAPDGALS